MTLLNSSRMFRISTVCEDIFSFLLVHLLGLQTGLEHIPSRPAGLEHIFNRPVYKISPKVAYAIIYN